MIRNPILPGFHPDASAIAVGEDYYIATSTFEWHPGICIYHSRDLANWRLAATPVRELSFEGDESSGGLWAPSLTYADGRFWLVVTDMRSLGRFKDSLNYITTCEAVDGIWSAPRFVNASGFDPSLFHDDDGRKYFLNMIWDYRPSREKFAGMVMQEYDAAAGKLIGPRRHIYEGTELGIAEGPQLLKKEGWYYLITAAGGTDYNHAGCVARSRSVWGPYEDSPIHPLITSRGAPELALQKAGHVSFLPVGDEWYITHLCGRPLTPLGNCVLGRETAIQKIEWPDGWPRLAHGGNHPALEVASPARHPDVVQQRNHSRRFAFDAPQLPLELQALRVPIGEKASFSARPGCLRLYGRESIMSHRNQSLLACRWQHIRFRAETKMEFEPENFQQLAGLALFYNTENFMYCYKTGGLHEEALTLNVIICEHGQLRLEAEGIPLERGAIYLAAEIDGAVGRFSYSYDGHQWEWIGGELPVDRLSDDFIRTRNMSFTGAMIALCAQDLHDRTSFADFHYLDYQEKTED